MIHLLRDCWESQAMRLYFLTQMIIYHYRALSSQEMNGQALSHKKESIKIFHCNKWLMKGTLWYGHHSPIQKEASD
ncbi:hypothetical protein BZG13_05595 [Salinivibrio sp. ML323]|nr:hypothetical protein BZG13_05595 [Salinivibrio sp. ML323]OOE61528.1 hypothetical protein BZG14_12135 [Salinivibrio sp. IB282]